VATDFSGHHDTATCSMFIGGLDNDPPVGLKVSNGFGLCERNHDLKAPGVEFLAQTDQGHIGSSFLGNSFAMQVIRVQVSF
jgi:hypothetical protein